MLGLCLYIRHVGDIHILCRIEILVIFATIGEKGNFLRYIPRTVMYGNVIGYTGLCGQHVYTKHQVSHFEDV